MTVVQLKPNEHSQSPVGTLFQPTYIRQALQLGIDGAGIVNGVYHGDGAVSGGPIPSSPHNLFYDYHLKLPLTFDVARGKKLLEDHGWAERNGVMTKNGQAFAFTLLYPTGDPSQLDELEIIQSDWAREGIKVTLKGLGASSFGATIYGPPSGWDMALSQWTYLPDYDPDGGPLYLPGGPDNVMGYSNSKMTALINATDGPATAAGTRSAFAAYQAYASKQVPELYLPTPDVLYAVRNTIHGFSAAYNPWLLVPNDNELTIQTTR
jgi:peptide/nickel transport system substrate-binding protein